MKRPAKKIFGYPFQYINALGEHLTYINICNDNKECLSILQFEIEKDRAIKAPYYEFLNRIKQLEK